MTPEVERRRPPAVIPSPTETARFGRPVARVVVEAGHPLDVEGLAQRLEHDDLDVVILRYPNRSVEVFSELMTLSTHRPLFADCLLYWECTIDAGQPRRRLLSSSTVELLPAPEVGAAVRLVFAAYPNHYAANPLFDAAAVVEGYGEWVTTLVSEGSADCLALVDAQGRLAAFSVIDHGPEVPEIRLAGTAPSHRGRGLYADLIAASMNHVAGRGGSRMLISTQAHNVTVMATWARLGWVPTRSVTTVHLVRRGLLPNGA